MIPDYPCKKDVGSRHYWVHLGVVEKNGKIYKIIECSQCREAIWDEVNLIYSSESRNDKEKAIKEAMIEKEVKEELKDLGLTD